MHYRFRLNRLFIECVTYVTDKLENTTKCVYVYIYVTYVQEHHLHGFDSYKHDFDEHDFTSYVSEQEKIV